MSRKYRGGFTLIELSLSLIFIAILSLMVVFLIQNISSSYRRGLILNQVNTVGMDLVDDFRISVQNATSDPVTRMCEIYYPDNDVNGVDHADYEACRKDNANSFVSVFKTADIKLNVGSSKEEELKNMPVYGAFCTGTYTYIWNSGYFENADNPDFDGTAVDYREVQGGVKPAVLGTKESSTAAFDQIYPTPDSTGNNYFRLLKIYDDERSVCVNAMKEHDERDLGDKNKPPKYVKFEDYENKVNNQFIIDKQMFGENDFDAVELLKKDDTDLVLYEFYVARPALSPTRQNLFYAASFILGTRRGGINIEKSGNSCRPPNDEYTELEYCAINRFNFAVMAGGK